MWEVIMFIVMNVVVAVVIKFEEWNSISSWEERLNSAIEDFNLNNPDDLAFPGGEISYESMLVWFLTLLLFFLVEFYKHYSEELGLFLMKVSRWVKSNFGYGEEMPTSEEISKFVADNKEGMDWFFMKAKRFFKGDDQSLSTNAEMKKWMADNKSEIDKWIEKKSNSSLKDGE